MPFKQCELSLRFRKWLCLFQVYGGEARISTLRKVFPLLEDKKSLTSPMERAGVAGKASLSAAVDYYVSLHSDVFISASPGNMHNALVSASLPRSCYAFQWKLTRKM